MARVCECFEKSVLGRTNKGESKRKQKKEREVEDQPVVCDDTEIKVRVYFKKIYTIVLNTSERPNMVRTVFKPSTRNLKEGLVHQEKVPCNSMSNAYGNFR